VEVKKKKTLKNNFYSKRIFHSKVMTRNLFFCKEWAGSFPARHKGKKLFLSPSMQSTFAKLFAHVHLVV
jgi:hypothetical protein